MILLFFTIMYYPNFIPKSASSAVFETFLKITPWKDGICSRTTKGKPSRKAYSVDMQATDNVNQSYVSFITGCMSQLDINSEYAVLGIYANYYRDGNDCAPTHSHQGQTQLVVSFGASRKLIVKDKTFVMNSGDLIIFGPEPHSVPQQPEVTEPRISLATFMVRVDQIPKNVTILETDESMVVRLRQS